MKKLLTILALLLGVATAHARTAMISDASQLSSNANADKPLSNLLDGAENDWASTTGTTGTWSNGDTRNLTFERVYDIGIRCFQKIIGLDGYTVRDCSLQNFASVFCSLGAFAICKDLVGFFLI